MKDINREGAHFTVICKRCNKKHKNLDKQLGKSNWRKALKTTKRLKKGFYDPTHYVQKMGSKAGSSKGGLESVKKQRKNKPYWFIKTPFDSNSEREIAINIYYQYGIRLIEGKNCHVPISNKEYDFFIKDCFIEYHPWDRKKTLSEYYQERRNILNKNGYKNYPLIIIK